MAAFTRKRKAKKKILDESGLAGFPPKEEQKKSKTSPISLTPKLLFINN